MSFGGQAVEFVTVTRGVPGYLGVAAESRSGTTVFGCHFRPFASVETAESETDVASETWKCTAPPVAEVLAMSPSGELVYDGFTFQIVGPVAPKFNLDGTVHHVTIMAKRQVG